MSGANQPDAGNTQKPHSRRQKRAAVGLKAMVRIAEHWQLRAGELQQLLGVEVSQLDDWRANVERGSVIEVSDEVELRMSYLVGIAIDLAALLPSVEGQRQWLRNVSQGTGGQPPLEIMLNDQEAGLNRIRGFLSGYVNG